MKKIIITLITVFSFGFSQTGMMTDDGMGVWLNASVMNIDGDLNDVDGFGTGYALGFDYMMDNGVEIGLDYWIQVDAMLGAIFDEVDIDYNPIDLSIMYHMKSDDISWYGGLTMHDFTDDSDFDLDTNSLTVGGYTDSNIYFWLNYNMDAEDLYGDDDLAMKVGFGKMFSMDNFTVGAGYYAYTDEMGEGWITLSVGSVF